MLTPKSALYLAIQVFVGIWLNGSAVYPIHVVGLSFRVFLAIFMMDCVLAIGADFRIELEESFTVSFMISIELERLFISEDEPVLDSGEPGDKSSDFWKISSENEESIESVFGEDIDSLEGIVGGEDAIRKSKGNEKSWFSIESKEKGGNGEEYIFKKALLVQVALPMETTTGTWFLQHYIDSIFRLSVGKLKVSEEEKCLSTMFYEKVACLADNDARLAVDPNNKYREYRQFLQHWELVQQKSIMLILFLFLLILEIGPYMDELSKIGGVIKEFVNPKYKDSTKTAFKSSTRLECMMQDYPKTLPPSARVGFTVTNPWLAYATVNNNHDDAAKVLKGNPYHSATSEERAIYGSNSMILRKNEKTVEKKKNEKYKPQSRNFNEVEPEIVVKQVFVSPAVGVKIDDLVSEVFNGQEVEVWSRVVWKPKWDVTFSDFKTKVNGNNNSVSQKSTLVIKGYNIFIEYLSLDGTLLIDSVDDAEVC
ncbi:hypothetical protein L2E82_51351 [Cichorium intybus]|nr:hypothetical protein L2E82_51351 [Cichorium intybus]